MTLRPRPFRVLVAVAVFYGLVWGLLLTPSDPQEGRKIAIWKPKPAPVVKPPRPADDPPQPLPGIPPPPNRPIPAIPDSLMSIKDQLVRPETREWIYIVVHHSASPSGNAADFDKMHREEKGWEFGLGYHFVVGNGNGSPAGAVEPGGRWLGQLHGAHAGEKAWEYNKHGIGVCVVGNFMETDMAEEVYSGLRDLVAWLAVRYGIPPERILPHNDVRGEPTECPGVRFPLDRLREDVRQALRK